MFVVAAVLLYWQSIRMPPVSYEAEYLRMDEPAYHSTWMKKWVARAEPPADDRREGRVGDIRPSRAAALPLREIGLFALLTLAFFHLADDRRAVLAFALFVLMPPAMAYLSRLDAWMDSVCWTALALVFFSKHLFTSWFVGGILAAFALDSKMTAALTLIPAVLLTFSPLPPKGERVRVRGFRRAAAVLAGCVTGWIVSQPEWVLHPSKMFAHVAYWNSWNSALPPLPVTYPVAALYSSIPLTIWCLAGLGIVQARQEPVLRAAAVLFATPVLFFMVYRTVSPDGIRHLFLALPFLAALSAAGFMRLKPVPRVFFALTWIAETFIHASLVSV